MADRPGDASGAYVPAGERLRASNTTWKPAGHAGVCCGAPRNDGPWCNHDAHWQLIESLETEAPPARVCACNSRNCSWCAPLLASAKCLDCGLLYDELMALDLVLPRVQWLELHPDDGGVLCANCIIRRASKLPGALSVSAVIVFCPDMPPKELVVELTEKECER